MRTRRIKEEARVIGFDDSPFKKFSKENNLIMGVVMRGPYLFEGAVTSKVRVDGFNSTKKLIKAINKSKFKLQLKAILLDGICLAGFNTVDINKLNKATHIPVIVVMRKKPSFKRIKKALSHTTRPKVREELMKKAGEIYEVKIKNKNVNGKIFFQKAGCTVEYAEEILKLMTKRSLVPEPLRIAHLILSAISFGESKGPA